MIRAALAALSILGGCAWISEAERDARWDLDGDGVERPADCDDRDPSVQSVQRVFVDADGDGFGDEATGTDQCGLEPGQVTVTGDCDDGDATAHPGAVEACDGVDNDCDGQTDEGLDVRTLYVDDDGDGFGVDGTERSACAEAPGFAERGGDCDDGNAAINPDAAEVCGGGDEDCDMLVDTDDPDLDRASNTWYPDLDGDGAGDQAAGLLTCTPDPESIALGGDCDDTDADVGPHVDEVCDGIDNDCDGVADEDSAIDALLFFRDRDADGYGDPFDPTSACSRPVGYVANGLDCNDDTSLIQPAADEVCDGIDNDCDNLTDDQDLWVGDPATWYRDADGDGFGTGNNFLVQCGRPAGYVLNDADCVDANPNINPAAREVCDTIDNDCDRAVDDDDDDLDIASTPTWYVDADGDGYGDVDGLGPTACIGPDGYVDNALDCNDASEQDHPGARELCDGRDNDCDSIIDEDTPTVWYRDADEDGYGDPAVELPDCNQPRGYVLDDRDCDDTDPDVHPGAIELCDGLDADCDGLDDDDDPDSDAVDWHDDADRDGFGDPYDRIRACEQPPGFVEDDTDCDDGTAAANPEAYEVCDGLDNDCDGLADDNDPDTPLNRWYRDDDRDGWGDPEVMREQCRIPFGFVGVAGDCDDTEPRVNDGEDEVCDGLDNDCDGLTDDADDSLDSSTAETWYLDGDGDGYGDADEPAGPLCDAPADHVLDDTDCDDDDATVWPDAPELCDGIDNDCDITVDEDTPTPWYRDRDRDGYGDDAVVTRSCDPVAGHVLFGGDCNDRDADINPGADEVCNGEDDDCDTLVDDDDPGLTEPVWYLDADGDGYGSPFQDVAACSRPPGYVADNTDCDDGFASVNPGATERCNLRDDDCDGAIDDADDYVVGTTTWWRDRDIDTYGDAATPAEFCKDDPVGYADDDEDCDDNAFKVNPGALEICDGIDNDCDEVIDDLDDDVVGVPDWFEDGDDDTWGDDLTRVEACFALPGQVGRGGDCDDADPSAYPGAIERCDGDDDDCDGVADNDLVYDDWYADLDDDTFGDPYDVLYDCRIHPERVLSGGDCDDTRADINPGGVEVCDGEDNDCDGQVDDDDLSVDPASQTPWWPDVDGDSWGDATRRDTACEPPGGAVYRGGDCDDTRPDVNPNGTEVPGNETDEDCSGDLLCHVDADQDGWGTADTVLSPDLTCDTALYEAVLPGDCDDADPARNPDAFEAPGNSVDEDCDRSLLCYVDQDRDGYGDNSGATLVESTDGLCDTADGQAEVLGDCDDLDPAVHPGVPEVAGNEVDEDCNGVILCFVDDDDDGWGETGTTVVSIDTDCADPGEAVVDGDCDDTAPLVNPAAEEVCDDFLDNDCDGDPGLYCRTEGVVDADDLDGAARVSAADEAGAAVAGPGLVTPDAVGDLLVGAPGTAGGAGAVYLLNGPPTAGMDLASGVVFTSSRAGGRAGAAVGGAGDVDGSGRDDLLIGAPLARDGGAPTGVVWLVLGGSPGGDLDARAATVLVGSRASARLGAAVSGGANIDGDGIDDYVIGEPGGGDFTGSGAVYVLSGSDPSGRADLVASAAWSGATLTDASGTCVSVAGDLDGDGRDDMIAGSPGAPVPAPDQAAGVVDVSYAPLTGGLLGSATDATLAGLGDGDRAGQTCAITDDIDGDGLSDMLVGAPEAGGGRGGVYVVTTTAYDTASLSTAAATFTGNAGSNAGSALPEARDVDGDGLADLVVGAPRDNVGGADAGAVYLVYRPLSGAFDPSSADVQIGGLGAQARLGSSVSTADVDGDGFADVIMGAVGDGADALVVLPGGGF